MIPVLFLLLTLAGPLMAAPAPKSIQVEMGQMFSFPFSEVDSYETFKNNVYTRALAFLNLSLNTQEEWLEDFIKFQKFVGVDETHVTKMMNGFSEDEDEQEWLDAATDKFFMANSTTELVAYVKERKPELGSKVEKFVNNILKNYNTVSEDGKAFVKKAYQYVTGEWQKDFPELTEEDRYDNAQIYGHVHGMFMKLSEKTREDVLHKMTWFIRPRLEQQYSRLMAEVKKSAAAEKTD